MPSSTLLILTVGTGTAGRDSFIAEGLRRTVELIAPRHYWLVPSQASASIDVADYIREHFPDSFVPWSDTQLYSEISEPDFLDNCRESVRQVIRHVRARLEENERLIVNPTSGTKQMSAGATIAALDEGVGELIFTVGDRCDGVVKTGTERLETFDASNYFAGKIHHQAAELFKIGAFEAASRLLGTDNAFPADAALCRCLNEWERLNYREALRRAGTNPPPTLLPMLSTLRQLAKDVEKPWPSAMVVADLLRSARHLESIGDSEGSIMRACKALEMGLRLDLNQRTKLYEPYPAEDLLNIPDLPQNFRTQLQNKQHGNKVLIGLRDLIDILATMHSPLAESYLKRKSHVRRAVEIRNNLTHQIRPTTSQEARQAVLSITELLTPLHLPSITDFPSELPAHPFVNS